MSSNNIEDLIKISPDAIAEIKRLVSNEKEDNLYLRLGVTSGGCSGMSYSMAFDTKTEDADNQFDVDGLNILIDEKAVPFLKGTILNYNNSLMGGGFSFENPNAKRSCGCGSSFSC